MATGGPSEGWGASDAPGPLPLVPEGIGHHDDNVFVAGLGRRAGWAYAPILARPCTTHETRRLLDTVSSLSS